MKNMVTKNCSICSSEFTTEPQYTNHKYCTGCSTGDCETCGKKMSIKPMAKKSQKFCNSECYFNSMRGSKQNPKHVKKRAISNTGRRTGETIECRFCGKEKYVEPSKIKIGKGKFCSQLCFAKWTRTPDNPNWGGEEYQESKRLRQSSRYKKWRKSVFERDDYTCTICSIRGGNLNADHIKSWALNEELRFEVTNGRTLCFDCHKKTESWGLNKKYQKLLQ